MNTKDREAIVDALKDAILREELPNREVARLLNFHPCYISMANNPNTWDQIGRHVWERLEEWYLNREKLSEFKIPEGEEIWQPKPKTQKDEWLKVAKTEALKLKKADPVKTKLPKITRVKSCVKEVIVIKEPDIIKALPSLPPEEKVLPQEQAYNIDTARLKVALDIEINLVVNGHRIKLV